MFKGPEARDPGAQGQKASVAGRGWEEEDVLPWVVILSKRQVDGRESE